MEALGTMKAGRGKDHWDQIKLVATVFGSTDLKVCSTEAVKKLKGSFAGNYNHSIETLFLKLK